MRSSIPDDKWIRPTLCRSHAAFRKFPWWHQLAAIVRETISTIQRSAASWLKLSFSKNHSDISFHRCHTASNPIVLGPGSSQISTYQNLGTPAIYFKPDTSPVLRLRPCAVSRPAPLHRASGCTTSHTSALNECCSDFSTTCSSIRTLKCQWGTTDVDSLWLFII